MIKKLLPLLVVLAAIVSLVFFSNFNATTKGNEPMTETATSNVSVILETSMGSITIEIDMENAPNTGANFLAYVDDGYFVDTIFHRVIPNFMVQGGGLTADMKDKPSKHAPIQNEANNGLKNERGTLAMARTGDPHSATSQFFVNHADNGFLNHSSETAQGWGYAVFGKVTEGMDIVDAMAAVTTGNSGGHQDVPSETITITGARRL
ncbi:MAG: peptidyl-prolyl cis-trans isomerase B (cyclophilin B) [Gammaproteobacteria bacterium]|jgi:peptidyl-prolyl cis-trans isomerase B (cyclophilin B)